MINCILEPIVLVLYAYFCFLQEEQILKKNVHGTSTRHSCGTSQRPNDETFKGRPWDIG